jgi:hypothetical protein
MNDILDRAFTPEEVRTTLFMMNPSKAPGVDGFNVGFFNAIGRF